MPKRIFTDDLSSHFGKEVLLKGWIRRLRETKSTTFIVLQDGSGIVQVVASPQDTAGRGFKSEDAVEIIGRVREEPRARQGYEVDLDDIRLVAAAAHDLPFTANSTLEDVGQETLLDYRPLSLRTDRGRAIFRTQMSLLQAFRDGLQYRRFTEIITSKIVSGGTEGGANLFPIEYFERVAYLAQSPQFYKEQCVAGFERVYETGHVYRAEPHATSRHLTEYYSLDFEMGFIDGPEDLIQLQRELMTDIFAAVKEDLGDALELFDTYLPSLLETPTWSYAECLERLERVHGRTDLEDDLDPEAERQLCAMAQEETGVSAVFVLGFPLAKRPFYTHGAADGEASLGFDLLFRGVEVTTGGQRLHRREDLEAALAGRDMDAAAFESHLRMFDLGMPPHGGLAIGLERLTAQVLGLSNVREATLYPRDRNRIEP